MEEFLLDSWTQHHLFSFYDDDHHIKIVLIDD